jgi:Flp pilus assembly pilin Flp
MNMLKKFWRDENGGESAEWPLVVGLLAVGLIIALVAVNDGAEALLNRLAGELNTAAAG